MRRKKITIKKRENKSDGTPVISAGETKPQTTREERIRKVNTELKELGLMEFNKSMKRYEYHIHINDYS